MMPTRTSFAEALHRLHATLVGELLQVEEAANTLPPEPLRRCLELIRTHVAEHFAFEEENGYLADVLRRKPDLDRQVDRLKADHRRLLTSLDGLLAATAGRHELDASVRESVLNWVRDVRRHEAEENRLVQDAFNVDISGED